MIDTILEDLEDVDKTAPERDTEDTVSGHLVDHFTSLLGTKPYIYRGVAGAWLEQFAGYVLLLKKQSLNLDVDKQQRKDFFTYAKALSALSKKVHNVRVSVAQDVYEAISTYSDSAQWGKPYWQFFETDDSSAFIPYCEVLEQQLQLDKLSVPHNIDEQVSFLLDKPTLEAANIVIEVLTERVAKGLPIERVDVKPLTDYDAGQWQELTFTIYVDLASQDANEEWDNILDEIRTRGSRQNDETVINSLSEKIGVHFRWKVSSDV